MVDTNQTQIAVRLETAAHMLDTSPSTVMYWIKQGRLPAMKVGRSWRVRVSDLNVLLERAGAAR